jgi:hypothetical protein
MVIIKVNKQLKPLQRVYICSLNQDRKEKMMMERRIKDNVLTHQINISR